MKKFMGTALLALSLGGCAPTKNVQSVKSADYSEKPHTLVAILEAPSVDPSFQTSFTDSVSRCGAKVSFVTPIPGQSLKIDATDAILLIHELGHETTTHTQYGAPVGKPWTSMIRLQITMTDVKSQKPVWKGQADFQVATFHGIPETDSAERWGDDLAGMMQKDGIFAACDFNRNRAHLATK
jgi:hypothetical protein